MEVSKKKNLKSVLLFVVVFCAAFFGTRYLLGGNKTEAKLKEFSEELNRNTPTMVDSETRLDSTSVKGDTLRYHYTLPEESLAAKSFDPVGAKEFVQQKTQENYDNSPQMEALREMNVVLHYFYKDGEGAPAFDFAIKTKQK